MGWNYYSLYGLTLRSEIPLPELAAVEIKKPAPGRLITFRLGTQNFSPNGKGETFQGLTYTWSKDRRTARISSSLAGQFSIHFPSKSIAWKPLSSSSHGLARVVLRGKVLGLLLTHLPSFLVLHGNVLKVNGRDIALCGGFRQGKSTLSSWLMREGALLHSDDTVALQYQKGSFRAHPGPPEIRLWSKSAFLLQPFRLQNERLFPETKKKRFSLSPSLWSGLWGKPVPLQVLYVLSRQKRGRVRIETLGKQERLTAILQNIYLPVIQNPKTLARQFELASNLVEKIPVKRLTYPSGLARLEEGGNALLSSIAS